MSARAPSLLTFLFEQPTKFELVINLKTAKALGSRQPSSTATIQEGPGDEKISFLLVAVIILTGCATALPPRPVSDFRTIAGTWRGSNNLGNPVSLIVYDNGRFEAIITTPQQTLSRKGHIRIEGPQLTYDIDSSYGRVTYQESDGKRRLARADRPAGAWRRSSGGWWSRSEED